MRNKTGTYQEQRRNMGECYYLCLSVATRTVTIKDDYGELIDNIEVCEKCHNILDPDKKFKWKAITGC